MTEAIRATPEEREPFRPSLITLDPSDPANLERIWRLDKQIPEFYDGHSVYPPFDTSATLQHFLLDKNHQPDEVVTFGLVDSTETTDPELTGMISLGRKGKAVAIVNLAIHPDHSGKGQGKTLMEAGERFAIEREAEVMVVYFSHYNDPALHLYYKKGFMPEPKISTADLQDRDLTKEEFNRQSRKDAQIWAAFGITRGSDETPRVKFYKYLNLFASPPHS